MNPNPPATTAGTGPAGMAIKVGVMGGASDIALAEHMEKAHALGSAAASRGCVLVTGACPGLPLAAACGAKQAGGVVVGISPAMSLEEHVGKYASPTAFHDVLVYTGSGLMGREVDNIRTSDVVVIVGGRSGTLGELAIAYDEGKLIGVVTGTGGISGMVRDILAACAKDTAPGRRSSTTTTRTDSSRSCCGFTPRPTRRRIRARRPRGSRIPFAACGFCPVRRPPSGSGTAPATGSVRGRVSTASSV